MSLPGFARVLDQCLAVRRGESLLLITDGDTDSAVVASLVTAIEDRGAYPSIVNIPRPELPGSEPPAAAASALLRVDAAIELTSLFVGSSRARQEASRLGVRYLAMPAVVLDTFRSGGPLDVDFDALSATAHAVGAAWIAGPVFV